MGVQGLAQGGVGLGPPECLGTGIRDAIQNGHPAQRQEDLHRSARSVRLLREDASQFGILGRRGAHQGHLRVPHMEPARRIIAVVRRNGLHAPEVDHVHAPRRDDLGQASQPGAIKARRSGAEDPSAEFIGPLGGGDIVDTRQDAVGRETLQRAPAGARGMEDHDLVPGSFKKGAGTIDQPGGIAEHAGPDHRPVR